MSVLRVAAVAVLATGCLSKPGFECDVAVERFTTQIAAELGMQGGTPSGGVDCGDDRLAVGVGFTLTRTPNGMFGEKTTIKAALRCAALSNRDGEYATGATEETWLIGGFATNVDGPFFAACPDGRVVTGLEAHIVGWGGLFNSIALLCSALDPSGAPEDKAERVPVTPTGTEPTDDDALCGAGKALHSLESVSGSELDRLRIGCAPTRCTQSP